MGFGGGWSSARWSGEPRAGIAALANEASDNFRVYAADRIRPAEIGPDQRAMLIRWTSARLGERVTIPDLSTAGYRYGGGDWSRRPTALRHCSSTTDRKRRNLQC
ncbi:hypothetical protein GCM10020258_56930 [Sphingomonas yabuuchiae]